MKSSRHAPLSTALILTAVFCLALPAQSEEPVPLNDYLAYARDAAQWAWDNYDTNLQRWRDTFDPNNVFGYRPPGGLLEMAVIFAHLYEYDQKDEYAERAKKVLLTYRDFRSIYPQWATDIRADYDEAPPPMPDFFTVMRYIRAYVVLKPFDLFSPAEHTVIAETIADSMAYLLRSQEWGTMNRAALRAESLAWAVRALPDHPKAPEWEMLRRALGDDNWGNWEIEDATIYHAVWLYALCGYAYARDMMPELFKTPEMYYYAQYFLHLMSPAGMIPDFGDAHWNANWNRYLVYFETAAALYRDPELKWAAATIARRFIDFSSPRNMGLAYILMDCYLWGTDSVAPVPPRSLSREVMEDVVGKKIVFRDGWQDDSTYLLLNYRDEGDGGLNFRDYLRDTIPVEEEKMTHGHADENSLVLLMSGGSVLLHDGGYRDYMPSGPYGAFRQDYFHNRLCVRAEKIFMGQEQGEYRYSIRDAIPGQGVLDFLHNAGSYRIVRTQKVDFITLPDFDYSRTRLIDEALGYEWDRVIAYVKDPELFVVFDIFKARREDYFTLADLWHTRRIVKQGEHWYDTVYDRIQAQELPRDTRLLIVFPQTRFRLRGVEEERRHYQDELVIHQTTAQHFELGESVGLVTVLIPHEASEMPEGLAKSLSLLPVHHPRAGLGVQVTSGEKTVFVGAKNNLRMDMIRDWRRPRYTYESGKIVFGDFETNGDFLFASLKGGKLDYTIVNLTRALYKEQVLVDVKEGFFGLAFDASPDQAGKGKLRYWRDSAVVER
jgi:hypothetical protein